MSWNKFVQVVAKCVRFRRGFFARFLCPSVEVHQNLFENYKFTMDLSLGRLQKIFYLKPDVYEFETQEALRNVVKPGMTVFDIGANTGYFTVLLASLVGREGRVYSFEPYPPNFKILKSNIDDNSLGQVSAFTLALSDKKGEASLSINPTNDGGHSLTGSKDNSDWVGREHDCDTETVQTTTLDTFVLEHQIKKIDFMKVDIEGAEFALFKGGEALLSSTSAPVLICEVGDIAQRGAGKTEKDLRTLLYSYGYKSYDLENGFKEFGLETPVRGLINVLFSKTPPAQ